MASSHRKPTRGALAAVVLLILLTAPVAFPQERSASQAGAQPELTDIIYPGALSPGKATGPVAGMASVSYIVRERYPSTAVLDFYDRELARIGYVPYVEAHLQHAVRNWMKFIDGTLPGEPNVRQFAAYWADPARKKRVLLVLRHYEFKDAAGNYRETEGQEVILQVYDFFELPKGP